MKYKFCSIRINTSKYDVTFATRGGGGVNPQPVATTLHEIIKTYHRLYNNCLTMFRTLIYDIIM